MLSRLKFKFTRYFSTARGPSEAAEGLWTRLCACVLSRFSHGHLCGALWTAAHQAPQSMGFSRQEHWSGLLCPPLGWTLESDLNSNLDSPIDPLAVQTLGKLLNSLFPVIFFVCLGGLFVRFKFSDGLNKVVELSAPWQSPARAPEPQALFSYTHVLPFKPFSEEHSVEKAKCVVPGKTGLSKPPNR